MGLTDGTMHGESLYITSDIAFAAYLMLRGLELLGAVDTGATGRNGHPRLSWGLTSTDPEVLTNMSSLVKAMADEFEHTQFTLPHDSSAQLNFRTYYGYTRQLKGALQNPLREDDI